MTDMMKNWLLEEEAGQGMVEYALIITFIALAVFASIRPVGTKLVDVFNNAAAMFET